MNRLSLFLLSCLILLTACNHEHKKADFVKPAHQEGATLWYQTSGELKALYYQGFQLATLRLDQYLQKPSSTKKPAVVVDIDETILDNSAHQVWTIKNSTGYPEGWADWTALAKAPALPGSLEFLQYAASKGVHVFYVTNRRETELGATIQNLADLGFPYADSTHVIPRTSTSSKVERRNAILQNHEIVLLCGDNLGDFDDFSDLVLTDRNAKVEQLKDLFGSKFIVFPNPFYGDWEAAIYEYNFNRTYQEKRKLRLDAMQGF